MVAGYAIGGGHVLHLCCDLTIAAENARFGQTGPRVGSFDGGYGIGAARPADRREAGEGDLAAVPAVRRRDRARVGAGERGRAARRARGDDRGVVSRDVAESPLALRLLKAGYNAGVDGLAGVQQLAGDATLLYYMSEEAQEGRDAYRRSATPTSRGSRSGRDRRSGGGARGPRTLGVGVVAGGRRRRCGGRGDLVAVRRRARRGGRAADRRELRERLLRRRVRASTPPNGWARRGSWRAVRRRPRQVLVAALVALGVAAVRGARAGARDVAVADPASSVRSRSPRRSCTAAARDRTRGSDSAS